MNKPSAPTIVIAVMWTAYLAFTFYLFYDEIPPLKRALVNIIGGFGLVVCTGTAWLMWQKRRSGGGAKDS